MLVRGEDFSTLKGSFEMRDIGLKIGGTRLGYLCADIVRLNGENKERLTLFIWMMWFFLCVVKRVLGYGRTVHY